jgi:hypothetical protein
MSSCICTILHQNIFGLNGKSKVMVSQPYNESGLGRLGIVRAGAVLENWSL